MSDTPYRLSSVSRFPERSPLAQKFLARCQHGPANLRLFLTEEDEVTPAELVMVLRVDQRLHWLRGERVPAETYLREFLATSAADEDALDLVYAEFLLREELGEAPTLAEYEARFPHLAEALRLQVDFHRALSSPTGRGIGRTLPENFGRYRILRLLGRGGMGTVYLAEDTLLQRRVALKVPHFAPADGPNAIERFYREARAAAALKHPNFCPVHDVGETDGVHYLAMEYLEGRPLSELLRQGQPWPVHQAVDLVRRAALALASAHDQGIVHRDLKPSNLMVMRDGEPIIMDFGLARRAAANDPRLTANGSPLGTPAYMPPEQVRGDAAAMGPASDIYSLGAVLYELLTGRPPFDGPVADVLAQILTREPDSPSLHRTELAGHAIERVCLTALARNPKDRFPSMREFAAALEQCLDAAELPVRRNRRRLARWQTLTATGAAAMLLACLLALCWPKNDRDADPTPPDVPPSTAPKENSDAGGGPKKAKEQPAARQPDEKWQVLARLISPERRRGRTMFGYRSAVVRHPYVYALDFKDFGASDLLVWRLPDEVVGTAEVKEVAHIPDAGDGGDLRVIGDTLLLTSRGGLEVFSLADPAKPKRIGERVGPLLPRTSQILIEHGSRVYLVGETGTVGVGHLSIFDVARPAEPRHLGMVRLGHRAWCGCIVGRHLYVGTMGGFASERVGVAVYDLEADPEPKEVGFLELKHLVLELYPSGSGWLIAVQEGQLQPLSLSDPKQPALDGPATNLGGWLGGRTSALVRAPGGDRLICRHAIFALEGKGLRRLQEYQGGEVPAGFPHHGHGEKNLVAVATNNAVFVLRFSVKP